MTGRIRLVAVVRACVRRWRVAAGATVGGVTGALVGLGIPEIEAKRYEGKIRGGNLLVSVHTENADEVKRAEQIFKAARADDICSTTEASVPKDRRPLA